jgi:excisionase family DNA binding protein
MPRSYHASAPDAGVKPVPNLPLAMRPAEAARRLGVSPRTLWAWTKAGIVPHAKVGGVTLYPSAALEAWLTERTCTADTVPAPRNGKEASR